MQLRRSRSEVQLNKIEEILLQNRSRFEQRQLKFQNLMKQPKLEIRPVSERLNLNHTIRQLDFSLNNKKDIDIVYKSVLHKSHIKKPKFQQNSFANQPSNPMALRFHQQDYMEKELKQIQSRLDFKNTFNQIKLLQIQPWHPDPKQISNQTFQEINNDPITFQKSTFQNSQVQQNMFESFKTDLNTFESQGVQSQNQQKLNSKIYHLQQQIQQLEPLQNNFKLQISNFKPLDISSLKQSGDLQQTIDANRKENFQSDLQKSQMIKDNIIENCIIFYKDTKKQKEIDQRLYHLNSLRKLSNDSQEQNNNAIHFENKINLEEKYIPSRRSSEIKHQIRDSISSTMLKKRLTEASQILVEEPQRPIFWPKKDEDQNQNNLLQNESIIQEDFNTKGYKPYIQNILMQYNSQRKSLQNIDEIK